MGSKEILSLTGLRGVAAMGVLFHHADIWSGADPVFFRGQLWVDVFFVLSGFVLSLNYWERLHLRAFALARFARIYPLHILSTVLAIGLAFALAFAAGKPWPNLDPIELVQEITLTTALPIIHVEHIWNDPSWSISVEWWTYFTVFMFLMTVGRRLPLMLMLVAGAILAVTLSVAALMGFQHHDPLRLFELWRAFVGMWLGWAAFAWKRQADPRALALVGRLAEPLLILIVVALYANYVLFGVEAWWLIPIFPVLVVALAQSDGPAARLLSARPVVWLGAVSFSIYLLHPLVNPFVWRLLDAVDLRHSLSAWLVAVTVPTLAIAALSHPLFEVPMRRWLRDRFSRS